MSGRNCLETDFDTHYAVRFLRRMLTPNGSSSSAPAMIVVGSVVCVKVLLSRDRDILRRDEAGTG